MKPNRIAEIVCSGIIILCYFLPLISIPYFDRNIMIIEAFSKTNGFIVAILVIPLILNGTNMCIKSHNYPAVPFFASLLPLYASLGIIAIAPEKGAEIGIGTVLMILASLFLFLNSSIRAAYYFKKHVAFLSVLLGWFIISIIGFIVMMNGSIEELTRLSTSIINQFN